jgi:hypothetical protein
LYDRIGIIVPGHSGSGTAEVRHQKIGDQWHEKCQQNG